jgi:diguanylate cyclase (GGDEF)-like protein
MSWVVELRANSRPVVEEGLTMQSRWLRTYLVLAALAIAGFLAIPDGSVAQTAWQIACGWIGAGFIVVGVRRNKPAVSGPWWLFAFAVAGNATGILIEAILARIEADPGFPSWADLGYLSFYPAAAAGLIMLVHRRTAQRDWSSLVDATTLTTGMGLLAWIFMVKPAASDPSIGLLGHIASVCYPVGDIVLLAMTARLVLGGSGRNGSFRLMSAALVCFLGGDTIWAVINQMVWEPGVMAHKLLAAVFLFGYLLFGAAALHPDVRSLARIVPPRPARLSRSLLLLLTVASLIGPAVLLLQAMHHQVTDGVAIAIGCTVLFLMVVTRMSQVLTQLDLQSERVRDLAVTDELTGLPNRRAWNTELPRTIQRVQRTGDPMTVAILDIDHFKRFNDTYGHPAGDRMLKEAAAAWQEQLRTADHLARYGGEEFVVLLPNATAAQACEVIDRMRLATPLGQSFSAGVATWDGAETSDELTSRADVALYRAKSAGRNRIAVADPAPTPA